VLVLIYNGKYHERISLFIAAPAVAAVSLLLNERLICPSTYLILMAPPDEQSTLKADMLANLGGFRAVQGINSIRAILPD